jgi:hypothetical protein
MPPKPPQPCSTTSAGSCAEPGRRQSAARTVPPWLEKPARWQSGEIGGNGGSVAAPPETARAATATSNARVISPKACHPR